MPFYRSRGHRGERAVRAGLGGYKSARASVGRMRGYRKSFNWVVKSLKGLRRVINVEKKKFDAVYSVTNIPITGTVNPLHAVAQGDTDQTRDGNSIKPLSLLLRYQSYNNATAGTTAIRVLIFRDLQQVGDTNPSTTDILDDSVAALPDAPLNNNTVGRFKILRDFKIILDTAKSNRKDGKVYIPLYGHIRYNGAAATDIQKGGLYILMVSDQATNYPTMGYNYRLTYVDN